MTSVGYTLWRTTIQDRSLTLMRMRAVLAFNLKRLRQSKGFSQEELAHRAEIDRSYLSDLERELYAASLDIIDKLALALEIDPSELVAKPHG